MTLGGADYYYIKNAQGDVVRICDESGNIVITYNYDAWGNLVNFSGSAALFLANPFRYRGYYYDLETGFYLAGVRYYDPVVGRWISPEPNVDNGEFDEGAGLFGYNVYVYCANNPVNLFDPTGEFVAVAGVLTYGAIAGGANFWNPVGWVILGVVAVGVVGYGIYKFSKGGKQRIRDTGLAGLSDAQIAQRLKDPRTSKSEKEKLKKEQKARGDRNKQKRGKKK